MIKTSIKVHGGFGIKTTPITTQVLEIVPGEQNSRRIVYMPAHTLNKHNNIPRIDAFSVSIAALLEIDRPDLKKYLMRIDNSFTTVTATKFVLIPHLNTNEHGGKLSSSKFALKDLAILERAMMLAYTFAGVPYQCVACEPVFNRRGVFHGNSDDLQFIQFDED